jgi:hypothetical protein
MLEEKLLLPWQIEPTERAEAYGGERLEEEQVGGEQARGELEVVLPAKDSGLKLCEELLEGELGDVPLSEALCKAYPELTYFVGLSVEADGMLSDKVAEAHEAALLSMELAVCLATGQPHESMWGRQLAEFCSSTVSSASHLHQLLTVLLLTQLSRVALLAATDSPKGE